MKRTGYQIWVIRGIVGSLLLLFLHAGPVGAKDPEYPTKPITCYIPYSAGGNTDLAARAFVDAAAKHIGQPFVAVNKAGAAGTLAAMAVMVAKADGYTVGGMTSGNAFIAPFSGQAPYKDLSGFTMLVNFGKYIYPIIVKGDAPWKTWKELADWARKNPRAATLGLSGARAVHSAGSVMWQVEKKEQIEITYIPFKGGPEILSATLGGHITMSASTPDPAFISYIQEGKLRILLYLGPEKIPGYEQIPSTQELYGFSVANICGLMGPKGLPGYVLQKLDGAFAKAAVDPDFLQVMKQMYMPLVYMDRVQVNKYVEETVPITSKLVQMLKAEDEKAKK